MIRSVPRALAKVARRAYSDTVLWNFGRAKRKVLVSSIPKAGTHLLTAVLQEYTGGRRLSLGDGRDKDEFGRRVPISMKFLEEKDALLRPGDLLWGHVMPEPERVRFFKERGYVIFLMIRDPRDMVCSRLNQALNLHRDHYHGTLSGLSTSEEQLRHVMTHFTSFDAPSIALDFQAFREWEKLANRTMLRFEQLVGPQGGGSAEAQTREMRRVEQGLGIRNVQPSLPTYVRHGARKELE